VGDKSAIEWTSATWNPTTGCDQISKGCDNCYALTMAARLKAMGQPAYQADGDPRTSGPGFRLTLHPDRLDQPLRWTRPRVIFVNSMSDLFHKDVPPEFIGRVFNVMGSADQHVFQVLTKRPKRMAAVLTAYYGALGVEPYPNVWLGTSVEDAAAERRIDMLRRAPAAIRFISAEPLIGPPSDRIYLGGVDWVILGGESGPGARPLELAWLEDWADATDSVAAALFVKQLGSVWARANGGGGKGGDPDRWPAWLRRRELPEGAGSAAQIMAAA
jgi:protein gp37